MSLINSSSRFFPPSGILIDYYGLQLKNLTAKKLTATNLTTNILFVK